MGILSTTSSRGYTPEVRGGKAERLLNKLCETFKEITAQSDDNSDRQVISLKLVKRSVSLVNDSSRQTVKLLRRLRNDASSSGLVEHIGELRSGAYEFLNDLLDHLRELDREARELLDALKRWTSSPDGKKKKEEPRKWWHYFKWFGKRRNGKDEDEVLGKLKRFDSGKKFCKDFEKSLNRLVVQQNCILEEFQRQEISKSIRPQRLKRLISIILLGFLLACLIASMVAAVALPVNPPDVDRLSDVAKDMMKLVNSERLVSWIDGVWRTKLNDLQLHEALSTRERRSRVDKEAKLHGFLPVNSSIEELKKELESRRSAKDLHRMKKKLQKKLCRAIDRINDSIKVVQSCKNNIHRREERNFTVTLEAKKGSTNKGFAFRWLNW